MRMSNVDCTEEICDFIGLRNAINEFYSWTQDGYFTFDTFGEEDEFKELNNFMAKHMDTVNFFFSTLEESVQNRIATLFSEVGKAEICE